MTTSHAFQLTMIKHHLSPYQYSLHTLVFLAKAFILPVCSHTVWWIHNCHNCWKHCITMNAYFSSTFFYKSFLMASQSFSNSGPFQSSWMLGSLWKWEYSRPVITMPMPPLGGHGTFSSSKGIIGFPLDSARFTSFLQAKCRMAQETTPLML